MTQGFTSVKCRVIKDKTMNQQRQYHIVERETGQASLSPEKELMLHILKEAKDNLTAKKQSLRADAHRWFAEKDSTWFFSYRSICEQMDPPLDPDRMRRKIFKKLGIIGPA